MDKPLELYQVTYSERVKQRLKAMGKEATRRGDREAFVAALKDFDYRLQVFPQFGVLVCHLVFEGAKLYNGTIRPLDMSYAVYEGQRLVLVVDLPVLLPKAKAEPGGEAGD